MKTEGLSWIEGMKAYAEGKRIRDRDGDEFWIEDGQPKHKGQTLAPWILYAPFSIILPEEKSLTFDEAIEAIGKGVVLQVKEPWQNIPRRVETTRQPTRQTICFLHTAEQRGWKITEVKDE